MNISQAKEQIKNAITAYLEKDQFGEYEIPSEEQRPIFLIGAPGIGKTAIMKQISQELGIGLISYSMTHHTRQSALGLPFITEKNYGGQRFMVSEYTMSEIIAAVYNLIEDTGLSEGILFLDEINCVSETLMPSMLQFLQFKTFGGHRVPDGWIIVTAGNPPEYNRSVHQLDVVTMDRLKRIDVEPDYQAWREYALSRRIHPSISSYLEIKKDNFYKVESTPSGKIFVTARGWMDLSSMIRLYEKKDITVDAPLVTQYLQHPKISRDFAAYYDLFRKYKADYEISSILEGKASEAIKQRAVSAAFDERLALVSLLCDAVIDPCTEVIGQEAMCLELSKKIKGWKLDYSEGSSETGLTVNFKAEIASELDRISAELDKAARAKSMSEDKIGLLRRLRRFYEAAGAEVSFDSISASYSNEVSGLKNRVALMQHQIENVFVFLEAVWPDSQEMLIFVTELTVDPYTSKFISHYDCPAYFRHSRELMFYERNKELIRRLEELNI